MKKKVLLMSIAIAALFSCSAKHDTAQQGATQQGATPAVALEIPEPEIRSLPKTKSSASLPVLSKERRKIMVDQGERAMADAWKAAIEHTPKGFAFVRGGRYKRFGSARDTVQEEDLLSYYMSDHEVTQAEYESVMGANPSARKGNDLPVESVNWYNAIEYCNKRSLAEGLTPYYYYQDPDLDKKILILNSDWNQEYGRSFLSFQTNDDYATGYRLPSDAEWEYAANGGVYRTNHAYSSGDDPETAAWNAGNSGGEIRNVKNKTSNALGLYDMSGNVMEWTDTRTGFWDNTCVRGGSWSDDDTFTVNSVDSYDVNTTRETLGFRVVRNVPLNDMRYPAIVFSDNLNVRDAPSVDGSKVDALPTLTPVAVYDVAGSGAWNDGTLDLWLKIADSDRWVNAYFVAMLPFFARETGRVNTFAELAYDVTDATDVRDPAFQLYWVDRETGKLIVENEYRDTYYRDANLVYGLPRPKDEPIEEERLYSLPDGHTERMWWSVYAKYESVRNADVFFTYSWAKMIFSNDHTVSLDEDMEDLSELDWSYLGGNRISFWSEYSGKHVFSVYFADERHMVLWERLDGVTPVDSVYWLCSEPAIGDEYPENPDIGAMGEEALRAQGLMDREPLARLLHYDHGDDSELSRRAAELIRRKVPVNIADRTGDAPLQYAVKNMDEDTVRALLGAGADPWFRSLSDKLPIDVWYEWANDTETGRNIQKLLENAMKR